jgi:hypothetical protein
MPKGNAENTRIGPGDHDQPGSSTADLRNRFLFAIRHDAPYVMEALQKLDGSEPALLAWATEWHLQDTWVMDVARRTLQDWRDHPAIAESMQWASAVQSGEWEPEPPAIAWQPTLESAVEFLHRAEHVYVPAVRRWANTIGLVGAPQKPKLTRDLSALVQYHVKGDDLDAVADDLFGGDDKEDAARKAITHLANQLGLALRQ